MSHLKEREEKICLNCGAELQDRFCHKCGQENVEPKESVWHFVTHFFNDVTHFDGMLFSTIKLLIFKPGFLSQEYLAGRRVKYLNPIRMYLFLSFVLFSLIFILPEKQINTKNDSIKNAVFVDSIKQINDSSGKKIFAKKTSHTIFEDKDHIFKPDTTISQYLANQKALPENKRDGWFVNYLNKRQIIMSAYGRRHKDFGNGSEFKSHLLHKVPQTLFISIPFFALILYFLYIRSRKHYYFVSHGIFTLHFYSTIYLFLILKLPFEYIKNSTIADILPFCSLIIPIYLFMAMKRFYKQGTIKTFFKWLLTLISSSIIFLIFTTILFLNTLLEISMQAMK